MATYDITTQTIDINSLETGDILNCPYTGLEQSIQLPTGKYALEVWGASSNNPSSNPGKGGYSKGILKLEENKNLYIYVGGKPSVTSDSYRLGGWNGGGATYGTSGDSGAGGGATDICLVRSEVALDSNKRYIRSRESYLSRLIVAGGAGGGYSGSYQSQRGGGYCPKVTTSQTNYIGGMTAPGSVTSNCVIGDFGYGATSNYTGDDYSGGGGGWYGGGSGGDSYGGGGSSFIWCEELAIFVPNDWSLSTDYYLTDTDIKYGNEDLTEPDATSRVGHNGNGYARITVIEVEVGNNKITYSTPYSSQSPKMCGDVLKSSYLPILSDDTHIFLSWYYEPTFDTEAKIGDIVTGDLTLYAKWRDKTYVNIVHHLIGCSANTVIESIYEGESYNNSFSILNDKWAMKHSQCYVKENSIDYLDFTYKDGVLNIPNVLNDLDIYVAAARILNLETIGLYEVGNYYKLIIRTDNDLMKKLNYTANDEDIILDKFDLSDYAITLEKFEVQYE